MQRISSRSTILVRIFSTLSLNLWLNRIFHSGPLYFDKDLIVLEYPNSQIKPYDMELKKVAFWIHFLDLTIDYLNKSWATIFGNSIGNFLEVYYDDFDRCWQPSIRVKIVIYIFKPLGRGIKIHSDSSMTGCCIKMRYERLADFCFFCGIIGHVKDCNQAFSSNITPTQNHFNNGPWLRFHPLPRGLIQRKPSLDNPIPPKDPCPSSFFPNPPPPPPPPSNPPPPPSDPSLSSVYPTCSSPHPSILDPDSSLSPSLPFSSHSLYYTPLAPPSSTSALSSSSSPITHTFSPSALAPYVFSPSLSLPNLSYSLSMDTSTLANTKKNKKDKQSLPLSFDINFPPVDSKRETDSILPHNSKRVKSAPPFLAFDSS